MNTQGASIVEHARTEKTSPGFTINVDSIRADAEAMLAENGNGNRRVRHADVFQEILSSIDEVNFEELAQLERGKKLTQKHLRVIAIHEVLRAASELNCGLCRNLDFVFAYNGEFWLVDRFELEKFLGQAAEKLGVDRFTARDYKFKADLCKQFLADAYLPKPERPNSAVHINLRNGTFEINVDSQRLRGFERTDFLTYQLPFDFDATADCPMWQRFLDEVLADRSAQNVLAEYFGYIFLRDLKLEKTLLLHGTGANGKSVVFDVMNAMLGDTNISNYSLESLCQDYYRAKIANVLLNYSSDISNRLQAEKFKLLTSGEPIEARLPYGQPMMLTDYARLAFNCNELPKDVEHSEAYFRRFLIVPFNTFIPEERRNPGLAREIIRAELSGVFNWVLCGLRRVLTQSKFSDCDSVKQMLATYRRESDSVAMFLEDEGYARCDRHLQVKILYGPYRTYCIDNGYKPLGRNNFSKRLEANNVLVQRLNVGKVAYVQQCPPKTCF